MTLYRLRRTLKHRMLAALTLCSYPIPNGIRQEWKRFARQRLERHKDVVIFGITTYAYRMQRPQHLAQELVRRGHRVFYVENEFVPGKKGGAHSGFRVERISERLYAVRLASPRNFFIYADAPTSDEVSALMDSVDDLVRAARITNAVAKVDHPFWGYIVEELPMPLLYDCMDEHAGFQDNARNLVTVEDALVKRAEAVLVSSKYLQRKMRKKNAKNIILLPNAGEFSHFSGEKKYSIPEDTEHLSQPIIGYYGAIDRWLDTSLVSKASRHFPKCSFLFIGRVMNSRLRQLARQRKNIYLLGEKPYDILPAYLHMFNVCTIPFRQMPLIKATHPVKFFEYAASGKPIVTTPLPELSQYKAVCYYAHSEREYIEGIEKALATPGWKRRERIEIARSNTWHARGSVLDRVIRSLK